MSNKINIEELDLFRRTEPCEAIESEGLSSLLKEIGESGYEEWLRLHLTVRAYMKARESAQALGVILKTNLVFKMPKEERWRASFNEAVILFNLKKYDSALLACIAAESTAPAGKKYMICHLEGDAYYSLKNYRKAVDSYNRALNSSPENEKWYLYCWLAYCYRELNDNQKVLEMQNKVLESNSPETAELGKFLAFKAACHRDLKQYREALDYCSKSLTANPPNDYLLSVFNIQAIAYYHLREFATGLEVCEKRLNDPAYPADDPSFLHYWKGRCLLALGQIKEAKEAFDDRGKGSAIFYSRFCEEIIASGGTVVAGVLTMKL